MLVLVIDHYVCEVARATEVRIAVWSRAGRDWGFIKLALKLLRIGASITVVMLAFRRGGDDLDDVG
jgi:hypothetical protein